MAPFDKAITKWTQPKHGFIRHFQGVKKVSGLKKLRSQFNNFDKPIDIQTKNLDSRARLLKIVHKSLEVRGILLRRKKFVCLPKGIQVHTYHSYSFWNLAELI